jgi:N-methylhydantoinase B/acetone carboxylase, alpha subunit
MPVFFDDELVAWTAALSHTTETGACEPGGMPLSAKSRFDEGMNLPPMKIGENHQLRSDMIEMFAAFGVRSEVSVTVDLRARCTTADRVRGPPGRDVRARGQGTSSPACSAGC